MGHTDKDWEGAQGSGQVVEHVIPATEHHAGLQHSPLEVGCPDNLLSGPLRFVVRGATVRTGSEKADKGQPAGTSAFCGADGVSGALDMNSLESLVGEFTIDSGTVRHRLTASEGRRQSVLIIESGGYEADSRQAAYFVCPRPPIRAAGDQNDLMSLAGKRRRKVPAYKPGATCNGYSHSALRIKLPRHEPLSSPLGG
jgi:hypothetical protein